MKREVLAFFGLRPSIILRMWDRRWIPASSESVTVEPKASCSSQSSSSSSSSVVPLQGTSGVLWWVGVVCDPNPSGLSLTIVPICRLSGRLSSRQSLSRSIGLPPLKCWSRFVFSGLARGGKAFLALVVVVVVVVIAIARRGVGPRRRSCISCRYGQRIMPGSNHG
uniref:(northern house mosquito) hypothetical protein n=1 Tax=Culex pipiens TaxID=7175 RepID=A0A8D8JQF1_CULPI